MGIKVKARQTKLTVASRFPSGRTWPPLPKYSDEFVQDSHLFPFSPDPDHIRSDTRCFIQFLTSIAFYPV